MLDHKRADTRTRDAAPAPQGTPQGISSHHDERIPVGRIDGLWRSAALAAAVTINFDSFADATNISGLNLGCVTITNSNAGHVDIHANRFGVGSHSGSNAIGSFSGPASINPMVVTFDTAVSYVQLFAGDAGGPTGDLDQWEMRIFDATHGGNLLASLLSPITRGSPYTGLSFTGAGIMRIEA